MTWVLAIILAIISNVSFTILAKYRMQKTTYDHAYIVIWGYIASIWLLPTIFIGHNTFYVSPPLVVLSIVSFFLFAISNVCQFEALREEQASVVAQIFPMNNLIIVLLSLFLFHSKGSSLLIIGCILILFGAIIAQPLQKKFSISKGTIYALGFVGSLGSGLAIEAFIVKSFSPGLFALLTFFIPAIINQFILLRPKRSEMYYEWQQQKGYIILNALTLAAAAFFLNLAFSLGNSAQIAAIYALTTIIVTIAGILFFKEHNHIARKLFATVIATIGVIIISM